MKSNNRKERLVLVMMWIFHERILLQTIVWPHNWGPVHREWIKEGRSFGKHDAMHIGLNFNFQTNIEDASNWQKKVVYPKIDLVFHFGIFSFVLRERTTMARNMHVCYRYYVQANIEDASKSATIKYFFSFVFSGLRIWPLVTFWFNWFHFLAMMLMTRMMKLGDKIILVYLTSFHSAQHQFAAHWVYKSRTITHLLFLIFLHLICW